jgi:putative endonuclease
MYYCYIALCADDSYYGGLAEDPEHRIAEHNSGKGAHWTAARVLGLSGASLTRH